MGWACQKISKNRTTDWSTSLLPEVLRWELKICNMNYSYHFMSINQTCWHLSFSSSHRVKLLMWKPDKLWVMRVIYQEESQHLFRESVQDSKDKPLTKGGMSMCSVGMSLNHLWSKYCWQTLSRSPKSKSKSRLTTGFSLKSDFPTTQPASHPQPPGKVSNKQDRAILPK